MIYGTASLDSDNLLPERVEIVECVMPHDAADGLVGASQRPLSRLSYARPTEFVAWDDSKPGFVG